MFRVYDRGTFWPPGLFNIKEAQAALRQADAPLVVPNRFAIAGMPIPPSVLPCQGFTLNRSMARQSQDVTVQLLTLKYIITNILLFCY